METAWLTLRLILSTLFDVVCACIALILTALPVTICLNFEQKNFHLGLIHPLEMLINYTLDSYELLYVYRVSLTRTGLCFVPFQL